MESTDANNNFKVNDSCENTEVSKDNESKDSEFEIRATKRKADTSEIMNLTEDSCTENKIPRLDENTNGITEVIDLTFIGLEVESSRISHDTATITSRSERRNLNPNTEPIDLTGDIILTDKHSKEPLFQSPTLIKDKNPILLDSAILLNSEYFGDLDKDDITINIRIKDKFQKLNHRIDQNFYNIFKQLADQHNVAISKVVLFEKERRIYPDDLPEKIGHKCTFIYECFIMDPDEKNNQVFRTNNEIDIKIQSDKWKRPVAMKISRIDNFSSVVEALCKEVEFTPDQISLSFDGDSIDLTSTPIDFDFEGGEMLDCRIKV